MDELNSSICQFRQLGVETDYDQACMETVKDKLLLAAQCAFFWKNGDIVFLWTSNNDHSSDMSAYRFLWQPQIGLSSVPGVGDRQIGLSDVKWVM